MIDLGSAPAGLQMEATATKAIEVATLLHEQRWSDTVVGFEFNYTTVAVDHTDTPEGVHRRWTENKRLGV